MGYVQQILLRQENFLSVSTDEILRLEDIVKERLSIDGNSYVFVTQDVPTEPGFPPVETRIVFFRNNRRYRVRLFKPLREVSASDLPVAWLLPSYEDFGDGGCC